MTSKETEEKITVSEAGALPEPGRYTHRYTVTATLDYLVWLLDPFQNPADWEQGRALGTAAIRPGIRVRLRSDLKQTGTVRQVSGNSAEVNWDRYGPSIEAHTDIIQFWE